MSNNVQKDTCRRDRCHGLYMDWIIYVVWISIPFRYRTMYSTGTYVPTNGQETNSSTGLYMVAVAVVTFYSKVTLQ